MNFESWIRFQQIEMIRLKEQYEYKHWGNNVSWHFQGAATSPVWLKQDLSREVVENKTGKVRSSEGVIWSGQR